MLKVIFYIKTQKAGRNGESPIFARINYQNQETSVSTGKSITAERWKETARLRLLLKTEKEKVIKNALENFQLAIERKFGELYRIDREVSLQLLKEELSGVPANKKSDVTIMQIIKKYNLYFKRKVGIGERSAASLQKYERCGILMKNFILQEYNKDDIPAEEITSSFVYKLEEFLKFDTKFHNRTGIKNNSVVKYIRMYKTVCNHAIKMEVLQKNPFKIYDGRISVKDAVFLSQEELDRIDNKAISIERLERVRDIFLFCCYTGYAPIDTVNLTSENLLRKGKNELWIMTSRTKTDIRENVPVLPPALRIIEKYEGKQNGLIPMISNQKMNAYLKEIADICSITKNLTWYVARHTFATTVTLGNGVRIEHVSAMMGHTNIKQTQHYAKVLDHNVMEDMAKVMRRYK
ncbi:site-specific integrase [uncultured Flavobacterium sp.]|uniref:site-specific integrase n=1 Tax=uncultured Flavobacterium sp. TaxID=165435 RepID=UPI0025F7EDC6|nr:site-specific integrase [uncultured Flavobacterium sp.]